MSELDPRLSAVSKMVIAGQLLADIGTDHALLPIYLVENNIVPGAIASDLADDPCRRAIEAVRRSGCPERIQIRKGSGLEVLEPGEVATIVIAGMGGDTITQILSADWQRASTYCQYVFQPMSRVGALREALSRQGWQMKEEVVVPVQQHFYIIISSIPGGKAYNLSRLELDVGPLLLRSPSAAAQSYKRYWLGKYRRLQQSLANAKSEAKRQEAELYIMRIRELEEILDAGHSTGH